MNQAENSYLKSKNLHLLLSVIFITPVALVYGLQPSVVLPELFDFKVDTIDLTNIFRAQMGLYLLMSCFWAISIIKPKFWITATITNILFMGGLATGRLISVVVDGAPSIYFLIGVILEFALTFWGLRNLKKYEY